MALASAVVAVATPARAAAPQRYAGRPLADVLEQLAGPGLRLIFNSELVPPTAIVRAEPRATGGPELVSELLAPHGLALSPVAAGTYAVVRAAPPPPARAADASPAPARAAVPPSADAPLADIVVAASRYALATDSPDLHVFMTQAQIERLPKLADEPLRAVHRLPGVAANGLSALAHVRGGGDGETQVLLDGMPLYEPFHLRNFLSPVSVLDARVLGALDVHTGGFPAPFGDRMSAVIEARTREPAADREQEIGASVFHANALSAGRFAGGRGDWLASVRSSYVGALTELTHSDYGEPRYADAIVRLRYAVGDATDVALAALHSRDEIAVTREQESSAARYHNDYAWATLTHRFGGGLETTWIASFTEVDSERTGTIADPGRRRGAVIDDRVYHAWGLKGDATWETGAFVHRAGVEARTLGAHYAYASDVQIERGWPTPPSPARRTSRALDLAPDGTQYAAYASSRWRPTAAWTVEAGLRMDWQDYRGVDADFLPSPRLNVRWDVAPGWRLRASGGRFRQAQGINELPVEDGETQYGRAQYADHAVLGVEHALPSGGSVRVEAYSKHYGSLRARYENPLDPLSLLPELASDRLRIAPVSASTRGLEALVAAAPESTPWRWWAGAALARATDRIDGRDVPRAWDQRWAVTAGADWTRGPWNVSMALGAHEGWPTTRITLDPATGGVTLGPRNAERLGTYASFDVRASRRYALRSGELQAWFEATNLTARRNACCVEYEVDGAPGAYSLDLERRIWPRIVPSIGVLYSWR
jgi:hypothetical protein